MSARKQKAVKGLPLFASELSADIVKYNYPLNYELFWVFINVIFVDVVFFFFFRVPLVYCGGQRR